MQMWLFIEIWSCICCLTSKVDSWKRSENTDSFIISPWQTGTNNQFSQSDLWKSIWQKWHHWELYQQAYTKKRTSEKSNSWRAIKTFILQFIQKCFKLIMKMPTHSLIFVNFIYIFCNYYIIVWSTCCRIQAVFALALKKIFFWF